MRKISIVASILLMSALVLTLTMSPVQAEGSITSRSWIGCIYSGYDAYYGATVYAYEERSTAILKVTVYNHLGSSIDVSTISVGFDWGQVYTSTIPPVVTISSGETRVFAVTFVLPSVTVSSNTFLHGYAITVAYMSGGTPGTMEQRYYTTPDFAVYSAVQADAQELYQIVSAMSYSFSSIQARLLMNRATNETNTRKIFYNRGDFAEAKRRFQAASNLITQAFSAEETRGVRMEDAQIEQTESMANFFNGMSSLMSYGGIAMVLFAIGYIIKSLGTLRKPTPP